jgi:hypothetical protein
MAEMMNDQIGRAQLKAQRTDARLHMFVHSAHVINFWMATEKAADCELCVSGSAFRARYRCIIRFDGRRMPS